MTARSRSHHVPMIKSRLGATKAPAHLTTTLYDVVAALQAVTEPDQDHLAVASSCTGSGPAVSPLSGTCR